MLKLFWPMVIFLSALIAGLVNFVFPDLMLRPLIVMWFLFICPGMVAIRFFRLKEPVTEWTLAIALSLVIDAAVVAIQLYSGVWSPSSTLLILICLCMGGGLAQVIQTIIKR